MRKINSKAAATKAPVEATENVHTDERTESPAPAPVKAPAPAPTVSPFALSLDHAMTSLDMTAIRARFARFGNDTLTDSLTDFVKADAMETTALPIVRVTAISRIMHDESALKAIGAAKDTDGKEYSARKAPLTTFLMDTLELAKTQATEYVNVARIATDEHANILPDFVGLSFSQLKLVCKSYKPYDAVKVVDSALSVTDYKAALDKWETEQRKADLEKAKAEQRAKSGGTSDTPTDESKPDESKPDGATVHTNERTDESKPDESKPDTTPDLARFVIGTMPATNSSTFTLWLEVKDKNGNDIPEDQRKPKVFLAKNAAVLLDDIRKALHSDATLTVKVPAATLKTLIARLPDALNGYKVHGAVFDLVTSGAARVVCVASVETKGTTEQDETTAAKAKRIATMTDRLTKWLIGQVELSDVFKASENPAYAMELYARAKSMIESLPRMTADKAVSLCVKADEQNAAKAATTETPKA